VEPAIPTTAFEAGQWPALLHAGYFRQLRVWKKLGKSTYPMPGRIKASGYFLTAAWGL
jgi:hypothetical protein